MKTNDTYQLLLRKLIDEGSHQVSRKYNTLEVIGNSTTIDMKKPLITLSERFLGYKFACAEASWILAGDNKVETIKPFSKVIDQFSDDGVHFFGAYGPKIIDQIEYIGRCFKQDINSRQAVLNIWREKPPVSRDIPCTLSLQFIIRGNTLHVIDTMRSSDVWLGIPYDWFSISMVGAYTAIYLRNLLHLDIQLGTLTINAGSQHSYANDFGYSTVDLLRVVTSGRKDFEYKPLDISTFNKPTDLLAHLSDLATLGFVTTENKWLSELEMHWRNK